MQRQFRYLVYLLRHKWFVFVAGLKVGAPLGRLLVHDLSKFRPSEWKPYLGHFYGPRCTCPKDDRCAACLGRKAEFRLASHHHKHRNPHHPEYWVDFKSGVPMEIPEALIREMVADWAGAGRAIDGKWEVWSWFDQHRDELRLAPHTTQRVVQLLDILRRKIRMPRGCEKSAT